MKISKKSFSVSQTCRECEKSRKPYFKRFSGFFIIHFLCSCYRKILNCVKSLKGAPLRLFGGQILPACGKASANVPLGFIFVKNDMNAFCQLRIYRFKPLGDVFMYGTFRNIETFCRTSYCGFVFYNVFGKLDSSFFNIIFHIFTPK